MKLKARVPVEQLDDERLTNIERKLVVAVSDMAHEPERGASWSRRGLAVAGFAMAVVIAGVVGWKLRAPAATQAPVAIAEAPFSMTTSEGTRVTVTHVGTRTDLAMSKGAVDLDVKHDPNRLFVVHAGDTQIVDVGTKFSVEWDGANHVEVRVTEGEVKVKRDGKEFDVTVNNAWSTETGVVTIAQLDSATTTVVASNDIEIDTTGPQTAVAPETTKTGSASTSSGSASQGSGAGSGKRVAGPPNARKALEKLPFDQGDDAGTDDPKSAIATYLNRVRDMAEGEDKARILYSIAVMQHRLKDDKAALHTLGGVLKRNGGASYKAGRWLELRIYCLKQFDDACRVRAERFRSSFEGPEAGIADQIVREIYAGQ